MCILGALPLLPLKDCMAIDYPATPRGDHTDVYHGTQVADPYRWLEQDVRESANVAEWVKLQSDLANEYLHAIASRDWFVQRLTALYDYERFSTPIRKGGRFFYLKNDGLQDQAVLYVADSPTADGRVLLDPNTWSADGTVSLSTFSVSEDGNHIAFAKSRSGSD